MKSVLAVIVALTAVATAAPGGGPPQGCKPATYACTHNPTTHVPGWKVCDVSGHWVVSGFPLPPLPFYSFWCSTKEEVMMS